MKIVVTGSAGFIGNHLCARLTADRHDVIGLDRKNGQDILTCDLPDADRVFHLAAQTDATSTDAGADAKDNIIGLLRVLQRYGPRAIFASSSMVNYPVTPYAISKLAGEHYARFYGASVVRFCNVFGAGGHSLIDRFSEAEHLTIYGDGQQNRTFAHVDSAVDLLIEAMAGPARTLVLRGSNHTVIEVADWNPHKPRVFLPAKPLDVLDGVQR